MRVRPLSCRSRPRRAWQAAATHPSWSVAAAVVAVAVIVSAAVILPGSHGPSRSLTASPTVARNPVTTTTMPQPTTTSKGAHSFSLNQNSYAGGATGGAANNAPLTTPAATALPTLAAPNVPATTVPASGTPAQPARIEQTGTLSLKVGKGRLSTTMTKLSFLATALGGFVANTQTQLAGGDGSTGSVTLQVPVASFSALLKDAQGLGTTQQLTTKATDVTGQYVNLQEQIAALEASRQQYLLIMSKATTIGDILSVQSQLDSIEQQIDQLQGQQNLLASETTYSTLTVLVDQSATHHHHTVPHHESGIDSAWHGSLHGFSSGVDGLIRIAGPIVFGLLCLAGVLILGRLSWRRYQRHRL